LPRHKLQSVTIASWGFPRNSTIASRFASSQTITHTDVCLPDLRFHIAISSVITRHTANGKSKNTAETAIVMATADICAPGRPAPGTLCFAKGHYRPKR
jgi:hypothetical protein